MNLPRGKGFDGPVGAAPFVAAAPSVLGAETARRKRLGVCTYSYNLHWKAARDGDPKARFKDAIEFVRYCHELGAGGVQIGVGSRDAEYVQQLRATAETLQMYFEGQTSLPRSPSDVDRFDVEIRVAREAGAGVVRTALLSGRRYETFDSAEAFRQFTERSWNAVTLAEPVVRKHGVKLAIENHKDFRVAEQLDLLRRLGSEYVGVNVDTGNNIALLEEPLAVVEALAPYAFTTHLKDMAVQDDEEGFLLSEVPLGEGFLDLKRIVAILERANPGIQFNLEMITRDPLRIPYLTKKYWATMKEVPARDLATAVALVRRNPPTKPLPRTSGRSLADQVAFEDENVRKSFSHARGRLGL